MQMLYQSTKKDKCDKANYQPVIIFPNISKLYEKIIYEQLYKYFNDKIFPSQCGFREEYISQHRFLVMKSRGSRKKI